MKWWYRIFVLWIGLSLGMGSSVVGCGGKSDKGAKSSGKRRNKKNGRNRRSDRKKIDDGHPDHDHWHPHRHEAGVHHHHPHPHPHLDGADHHHAF